MTDFLLILSTAFALALDAFAVAAGISSGAIRFHWGRSLRLSLSFGAFQSGMAAAGWLAARRFFEAIRAVDHWLAFGLLLFIGGRMILSSSKERTPVGEGSAPFDPTRGLSLLTLSVATSLDALAVGLSLAVLDQSIVFPAAVIGIVAFVMTFIGSWLGGALGRQIGRRAEFAGGLVLWAIGIKILVDHLF